MITQEQLKERLTYKNGKLYWSLKKNNFLLSRAGCLRNTGYWAIRFNKKLYQEHNLVWLYFNGVMLPGNIDHINRNRIDNRISNLRIATRSQNNMNKTIQSNNTSGYTGVYKRKDTGKWTCYIGKDKKFKNGKLIKSGRVYLGCFETKEEAVNCRRLKQKELFKEFSVYEN